MIMHLRVLILVVSLSLVACGTEGEPGADGAPGPVGPGINQSVNYFCIHSLGMSHDIYKFPDGSIMTSCELSWANYGQITSGFNIWRNGQNGTTTATCMVSGEYNPGIFKWDGNLSSTLTIGTTQSYALTCTKY